jgi:hypothetical protein
VAKCRGGAGGSARQLVSDGSNGQVNVWGYLGDFSLPAIEEVGGEGVGSGRRDWRGWLTNEGGGEKAEVEGERWSRGGGEPRRKARDEVT